MGTAWDGARPLKPYKKFEKNKNFSKMASV